MAELKHIKTFESFADSFEKDVEVKENIEQDFELLEEGVKDFVKKISDKVGMKVEDFLTQWKSPKVIEWAKKKAKSYLDQGKLDKDAYEKALAVDFDPSNPQSRDFFVQMAKIKGALSGVPTSAGTRLMGAK